MKTLAALAVTASLFALAVPDTGAEANTTKLRVKNHDNYKISCNTARHMVREQGYNPVRVKSCTSTVFSFYAQRNGRTYVFYVHSRTGFVWRA
ncbi:hypothetical protein G5V57_12820 [Nordella sp. HKS 07]|uniref:hypothetical protein n=1 Tax=Nordella sp. HKS 07 TaxID=2712222 RepID=UPI0013E1814F|nr:hypothetical protein [Nordella sp. HKS 07]QIG48529.1 hypothetical protein G5V57_12820 [Nordella sp. HKS 07]